MVHREQFEFGTGSFVGQALNEDTFYDLSPMEQARIAGWVDSCPVVEELIDPANPNPGRGPEAMLERYGEANAWFSFITQAVKDVKPELYEQMITPVKRQHNEPLGKYEAGSVPPTHYSEMSPMATLPGYALPRLLIKQIGSGTIAENQSRLVPGLEILDNAVHRASTPAELLAVFAEGINDVGIVDTETVLASTLSQGWFSEHNARVMLTEVEEALANNSPTLWAAYQHLSAADKDRLKIAHVG